MGRGETPGSDPPTSAHGFHPRSADCVPPYKSATNRLKVALLLIFTYLTDDIYFLNDKTD